MPPGAASFPHLARPSGRGLGGLVALLIAGSQGLAQGWPAKTVRIVVPFAPGGTADTLGRLVSQRLSETMKENFIVENRAGAGGVIGSDLVAQAGTERSPPGVLEDAAGWLATAASASIPLDP